MSKPLVSVVIPTYKRPEKLEKAIESVLYQSYENIEITVVNDYPKTNIENQVSIERDKINYLNHSENKGGSGARNTGIENSQGDYIAFLDDDDQWEKEKIEKQVQLLESKGEEYGAAYTWAKVESEDGEDRIMKGEKEGDIRKNILLMDVDAPFGSTIIVRKDIVDKISGFDESFQRQQDWEFMIRVLEHTKVCVVKRPLIVKGAEYGFNVDPELVRKMRQKYLNKFKDYISSLDKITQQKIYATHYSIIARSYAFHGKITESMRYYLLSLSKWPFQKPKNLARPFYYILKNKLAYDKD